MSTSPTSINDSLQLKINALSVIPGLVDETDWAERFLELWNISIPLAVSLKLGHIEELTDSGVEEIEKCFTALALTLSMSEDELQGKVGGS